MTTTTEEPDAIDFVARRVAAAAMFEERLKSIEERLRLQSKRIENVANRSTAIERLIDRTIARLEWTYEA